MFKQLSLAILLLILIRSQPAFAQEIMTIGAIQGTASASPFEGEMVTFEGIVTGVFSRPSSSGAVNWVIFVQDAPGSEDGNPATSDAIAVYVGQTQPSYQIGDLVRVQGEVIEFFDLTEISGRTTSLEVLSSENPLPNAIQLQQSTPLEQLEAMLVAIRGDVVATASCQFYIGHDEFDVPVVASTQDACAAFDIPQEGATVSQVIGPLHYNFDEYKVVVQSPPLVAEIIAAPAAETAISDVFQLPPIANGLSPVANLFITEVYYQMPGLEDEIEWVEITNIGDEAIDIGRFKLGDEETRADGEGFFRFPDDTVIPAGTSIVVANNGAAFMEMWGFFPNFEMENSAENVPTLPVVDALGTASFILANGGDEVILLDENNAFVSGLSYGESTVIFTPPIGRVADGESIERRLATCDNSPFDFAPQRRPNPGLVLLEAACSPELRAEAEAIARAASDDSLQPIGVLQGDGLVSPFLNRTVTFEGVVTALHVDQNSAGIIFYTLYVQDPPGREDGDPATSDGMPVFLGRRRIQAQVGDLVRVTGTMSEYFGLSEIEDDGLRVEVLSSGNVLPTPIEINPPNVSADELIPLLEPLEGMRVHLGFEPARVVGATFDGCGLSVVRQDSGVERLFRRSIADPIGAVVPILNDSDVSCPDMPKVKFGDQLSGLVGVLTYNFEQYKILVGDYSEVIWDEAPFVEPPIASVAADGQFSIISYNVENFFDGIDDTGSDAEPKLSDEEIATKRDKIAYALGVTANCPTIIAIQEVEKASLLDLLAEKLVDYCSAPYAVVHADSADGRGIDVAYLVDGKRVEVISAELAQTCSPLTTNIDDPTIDCPAAEQPLFSRPPYVLTASVDGVPLTIINNHFKSKRGGEAETEARRIVQAVHVSDLVKDVLVENPKHKRYCHRRHERLRALATIVNVGRKWTGQHPANYPRK